MPLLSREHKVPPTMCSVPKYLHSLQEWPPPHPSFDAVYSSKLTGKCGFGTKSMTHSKWAAPLQKIKSRAVVLGHLKKKTNVEDVMTKGRHSFIPQPLSSVHTTNPNTSIAWPSIFIYLKKGKNYRAKFQREKKAKHRHGRELSPWKCMQTGHRELTKTALDQTSVRTKTRLWGQWRLSCG